VARSLADLHRELSVPPDRRPLLRLKGAPCLASYSILGLHPLSYSEAQFTLGMHMMLKSWECPQPNRRLRDSVPERNREESLAPFLFRDWILAHPPIWNQAVPRSELKCPNTLETNVLRVSSTNGGLGWLRTTFSFDLQEDG
jgi:hypothetical protein